MDIVMKLNEFSNRKSALQTNVDLSTEGRRKAMQAIDAEAANYRGEVLRALRIGWDDWKVKARRNIEALQEATDKSAAAWDYNRLNYQVKAINNRIATAGSFADVAGEYQRVKESGDRHAWRAWTETAGATIRTKYPSDPDAAVFVKRLSQDAPEVLITPEVKTLKEEGDKLSQQAAQLDEQTQRANAFYHPNSGGVFGEKTAFDAVADGVQITRRVIPETLATETHVSLK